MEKQFIKERIDEKVTELKNYLDELSKIKPSSFEQYQENFEKKAACERYAEKIPEAIVDLAILVIRYLNLPAPKDDKNTFEILAQNNIISQELSKSLQDAKGMRNIIAHEYGKVDDEIVFDAISSELEDDTNKFLENTRRILEMHKR